MVNKKYKNRKVQLFMGAESDEFAKEYTKFRSDLVKKGQTVSGWFRKQVMDYNKKNDVL